MKSFLLKICPWLITLSALYFALNGLNWDIFFQQFSSANSFWLILAVVLTFASYALRSFRWKFFFENKRLLPFFSAFKVLSVGFFMNNILPARAGEIVRAHAGAKITQTKRTLILATIASERLADGLALSFFLISCSFFINNETISSGLNFVAIAFALISLGVVTVLIFRKLIFNFVELLTLKSKKSCSIFLTYLDKKSEIKDSKFYSKIGRIISKNQNTIPYLTDRFEMFINGLAPLCNLKSLLPIIFWSLIIWSIELFVYISIAYAFNTALNPFQCILFMVAVNFSSLVPSAPGGIGVIEWVATATLMSLSFLPDATTEAKHALSLGMVVSQHVIQFIVVALLGLVSIILLKKEFGTLGDSHE